jgi:hypothetical protein
MTTKVPGTYDDADLILKLYDLRREERLRAARKWFAALPPFTSREQFLADCPPGTEENASFRMVTSYWDMASAFVVNGILNAELFYRSNSGELLYVWERVRRIVPALREAQKNPLSYRNLEEVAKGFIEFYGKNAPGYYENLVATMEKQIPASK